MPKRAREDDVPNPIRKKERLRLPSNKPDDTFARVKRLQERQSSNFLNLPSDVHRNIFKFLPLSDRPSINMTHSILRNTMREANNLTDKERRQLPAVLHKSIRNGNPEAVKDILSINRGLKPTDLNKAPVGYVYPPLVEAVKKGNLEMVKALVEKGADQNKADWQGRTPLWDAALYGHLDIVRYLVEEVGQDANQADEYGTTPIHAAASNGHLDIVRYFVEEVGQDANKTNEYGTTPIYSAALNGHLDIVRYFVEEVGQDANKTNEFGTTPILAAASSGHLDVVRYLVEEAKVQDPGKANNDGWTPIYSAAIDGHLDVVRYLVEEAKVQDPNKADIEGRTPIYVAAFWGHLNVVRYLVEEAKVDFNKADNGGWTPLKGATARNYTAVADYLRSIGAKE